MNILKNIQTLYLGKVKSRLKSRKRISNLLPEKYKNGDIEDIKQFFETVPVMRCEQTYTNADGEEKKVVLEGVETFFI